MKNFNFKQFFLLSCALLFCQSQAGFLDSARDFWHKAACSLSQKLTNLGISTNYVAAAVVTLGIKAICHYRKTCTDKTQKASLASVTDRFEFKELNLNNLQGVNSGIFLEDQPIGTGLLITKENNPVIGSFMVGWNNFKYKFYSLSKGPRTLLATANHMRVFYSQNQFVIFCADSITDPIYEILVLTRANNNQFKQIVLSNVNDGIKQDLYLEDDLKDKFFSNYKKYLNGEGV